MAHSRYFSLLFQPINFSFHIRVTGVTVTLIWMCRQVPLCNKFILTFKFFSANTFNYAVFVTNKVLIHFLRILHVESDYKNQNNQSLVIQFLYICTKYLHSTGKDADKNPYLNIKYR